MARNPKPEEVDPKVAKAKESDKALLLELRDRYKKCVEADKENRKKYRENMRFTLVPGEQWDATTKKERGQDRPMYEFNEIRIKCKAVVNQIRSNRPSAKITPAEDGDVELAEAMKGLIDQIQNASDADSVMDYATEHQVIGGMGAERYITRWQEDSVDGQDIIIEPIKNPLCLYADYACQNQDKSDARFWIYAAKLTKEVYKAKYPNAEEVEFEVEDEFDDDCDDEHVWVAEYWKKKPIVRELLLLSNGKTVDAAKIDVATLPTGVTVIKSRKAPGHEIVQYICSGNAVLADENGEKEHAWAGKEFPFNIAYGEYSVVDGKEVWYGLPEHGKDAQRAHNWAATSVYEAIASTPQGTTWVTAEQAKDLMPEWANAVRKNIRIKRYNHDPKAPGPPVSEPPASVPTALVAAMQMSSDSLKAVLGMPDATLGEKGAENSGVAIRRRQEAGAVANYNFGDNMTKFARRRTEILLDLVPKIYDTAKTIRVLGKDGSEKWIKINQPDPVTGEVMNDLSAAKYDLVVTPGPNYATQRQEAADFYTNMAQSDPGLMATAPDLVYKTMDYPLAQEIAERRRMMLPQEIQQQINGDARQDPAVAAAMMQVSAMQAQIAEQAKLVDEESANAQSEKNAADKAKSDVQIAMADLKVMQAEIDRQIAEFKTQVAETQLRLKEQQQSEAEGDQVELNQEQAAERQALFEGITDELESLKQEQAQMMAAYAEQLAQLMSAPRNRDPLSAVSERVNGEIVTTLSDGRQAVSRKVNGKLHTHVTPTVN